MKNKGKSWRELVKDGNFPVIDPGKLTVEKLEKMMLDIFKNRVKEKDRSLGKDNSIKIVETEKTFSFASGGMVSGIGGLVHLFDLTGGILLLQDIWYNNIKVEDEDKEDLFRLLFSNYGYKSEVLNNEDEVDIEIAKRLESKGYFKIKKINE